jgi:hypothetical protein
VAVDKGAPNSLETDAGQQQTGDGVAPTLTLVARKAAELYRHHLIRVVVIAFVVFAPIDLAEKVVDDLTNDLGPRRAVAGFTLAAAALGVVSITLIAEILYAGLLDYTVGPALDGRAPPSVRSILLHLPYWRLLAAELLASMVIILGFLLLFLPGVVALTLLSVTGPVVILEGRRPFAALRRSAHLIRSRWRLAAAAVTLPLVGGSLLESVVAALLGGSLPTTLVVDVAFDVTIFALAGLMIAVLGHLLVKQASTLPESGNG